MATTRRSSGRKRATAATAASSTGAEAATAGTLTCPECGKTFTRPAALGAHRARVHGVAGTSQNARSRRSAAARRAATTGARPSRSRTTTPAPSQTAGRVDHDALLRALFPDGIPPRQETIVAVNDWLAQADALARLR
jgi:hypothetical protein